MPNLQHWLNAWIKVNAKQQGDPFTAGASSNNRHHASFGGNSSNNKHHGNGHGNNQGRNSHHSSYHSAENGHDAVDRAGGATVSGGQAAAAVMMKERNTSNARDGSLTPMTESTQSTSYRSGETRRPSGDGRKSGSTTPRPIDQEMAAIRKFNSRKHKRRLNRTNSFSDLLRERAHHHQSALRTEQLLEQTTLAHAHAHAHHHNGEDSERRRHGHSSNIHHHPLDHDPHHHFIPTPPPPPTLHHHPVVYPPSQDAQQLQKLQQQQQYILHDSTHSTSPTETASTALRSNLRQQQQHQLRFNLNYETEEDHNSLESSHSALFGVADFFGTEINDFHAPHPPSSARRHHRTQMKTAQHGLGDEQPHYLRSHEQYLVPPQQEKQQQQQQGEVQEPPSSSAPLSSTHSNNNNRDNNNFTYNTNNTNNTSSNHRNDGYSSFTTTRQNKHYTQPLTDNHARFRNNKSTIRNHTSQSSQYYANGYNNSQVPARYQDATPTITSSSSQRLLPGQSAPLSRHVHITESDATAAAGTLASSTSSASNRAPGIVVGGVRLPFFNHSNNTNTTNNTDSNSQQQNAFGDKANCPGCKVAQAELQHTQESLEYMREMAIRKEYKCPTCKITSNGADHCSSNNGSIGQPKKAHPVLKNSSQQLAAVTERHKKQVEQLMKERNHWQRNMHIKLEKLAGLCQHLNTESSLRSEESRIMPEELEKVKAERDQMAGEIEQLKATVKVYEKEREEHRQVQERMVEYENHGLRQAQEAIAKRDETIAKLSARLETTLDTLALEREQQRQRRQIFFPQRQNFYQTNNNHGDVQPNNHHSASPVASTSTCTSTGTCSSEQEELKRLRAELLESQRKLELSQMEARQRENALRFRCESLQEQLDNREASPSAGSTSRKSAFSVELHPLSGKDGWESC